jgi:hypothetical protein
MKDEDSYWKASSIYSVSENVRAFFRKTLETETTTTSLIG